MNKKLLPALVLSLAILVGAIIFITSRGEAPVATNSISDHSNKSIFTTDEIAQHSTMNDCWTIIDGGVYDITNYVPMHQGGEEILRTCGVDGTNMFTERRTVDGEIIGSGTPHSNTAKIQLAEYKIGVLNQ